MVQGRTEQNMFYFYNQVSIMKESKRIKHNLGINQSLSMNVIFNI